MKSWILNVYTPQDTEEIWKSCQKSNWEYKQGELMISIFNRQCLEVTTSNNIWEGTITKERENIIAQLKNAFIEDK